MTENVRIGVDVGGTFTDVALLGEDNSLVTAKVPSTVDQSDGVMNAIAKSCDRSAVETARIDEFTHAMTVSINALLEHDGSKTALVTTEGFRDVLEIGRQTRPALYDMEATKGTPLVPRHRRFEVDERASPSGVEKPVTDNDIDRIADRLRDCDAESVAIVFLHSYSTPDNEIRMAEGLRTRLDIPVSVSHEVLAEFREYERASTTVADAYVRPPIDAYLGRLTDRANATDVPAPRIMQSNGGISDVETARQNAATTIMSGPAAGVVGAHHIASPIVDGRGLEGIITFDMGGTSSDVSLARGDSIEKTTDSEIDDHPIRLPMVDVNTIGSGGGSVAWVDAGGALRVGPRSTGAEPGPACYGKGGTEPTVTDANVLLGYIGPDNSLGGELSLDPDAAERVLASLADEAGLDSAVEAAEGIYRVANAKMTRTIRGVSIDRGHDPREFALVAFGGAGPLHAAALAERLDIGTIAVPLPSGVLSAFGLLAADERSDSVRTHRVPLSEANVEEIEAAYDDLTADALKGVRNPDAASVERSADLRYDGQSFELEVPVGARFNRSAVRSSFQERHSRVHGYRTDAPVELVNVRVAASVEREVELPRYATDGRGEARIGEREAYFDGAFRRTPVYDRAALSRDRSIDGPAVLEQRESTTVIPPGWRGTVRSDGTLVLDRGER